MLNSDVVFAYSYWLGLPALPLFVGALLLKGDISPNGLQTLCLHFTSFVASLAQDSIPGLVSQLPGPDSLSLLKIHRLENASFAWRT